ncbi:GNAT family N-acetyltransferase [Paracoccus sp. CPCC 101403]|uniref:GNAT family N-acetyltransferase n=1 Tax=Paracoccus broussonetiae TaxID=3075834 RepID=A0ABU3EA92_9RHOB|nr:GNAT family N-acetyltransferase [Paracoccus sp. CPCC 101403]MDT1061139.1 GNAT family N-acetyltransferase [Paracoccus sp. CPCC 101403]
MSGCACGHHHPHHHHAPATGGAEIALSRPLVALSGRLTCADMAQMMLALDLLPDHVKLSRAEPGNLRFDLAQTEDPLVWRLDELFADAEAFAAHQSRTAASDWGQRSRDITRAFERTETLPRIRPEHPLEAAAISELLRQSFGGGDEARLVEMLRDQDDLTLSLVAEAAGCILGHVALSPLQAEGPALALAPVAVHPAVQRRGIGDALIRAALAAVPGHTIVVMGDPAYYARFGFQPVDLGSPYAGPYLMALGPALPKGSAITHARAFSAL